MNDDKLYLEGYKIYRSDNESQRRKGVAIIINNNLIIDAQKIAADPNGRFLKVRIKNKLDDNSINISTIYLEPNGDINNINSIIFESDIIGGDMNNAQSNLDILDVYHYKNIEIIEKMDFTNNRIFDHPILFGIAKFGTHTDKEITSIKILDKNKVQFNNDIINKIYTGEDKINKLTDPFKTINTTSYEQKIDIQRLGEEYANLKEEIN